MTDWRKIEMVLVNWFRGEGAQIAKEPRTGERNQMTADAINRRLEELRMERLQQIVERHQRAL